MKKEQGIKNSQIYFKLSELSTESILYLLSITTDTRIKNNVVFYFTDLKKTTPETTGEDLKKMGLKPGPLFGEIFNKILEMKLDGKIKTYKDEIDFVKRYL